MSKQPKIRGGRRRAGLRLSQQRTRYEATIRFGQSLSSVFWDDLFDGLGKAVDAFFENMANFVDAFYAPPDPADDPYQIDRWVTDGGA